MRPLLLFATGAGALLLSGCGVGGARPATSRAAPPLAVPTAQPGMPQFSSVRGQNARALISSLGTPRIDVQEGRGRKLQFLNQSCVLDAYLYSPGTGKEPVVTHVDTRLRNGTPAEEAGCVAALAAKRP